MIKRDYIFSKDTPILIYGTGGDGLKISQQLLHNAYQIRAFIDQRASEIKEVNSIPVFTIEEVIQDLALLEDTVIIITLKNIFAHHSLATDLVHKGFNRIICLPISKSGETPSEPLSTIASFYSSLLSGDIPSPPAILPFYAIEKIHSRDRLKITENHADETTVTWTPIELIYNYTKDGAFENCSMPLFFPLVDLYRAFLTGDPARFDSALRSYQTYASEFAVRKKAVVTEQLLDSMIASRHGAFRGMIHLVETKSTFFIENAPSAEIINGRFHLTASGRNRVAFLIARGYALVPLTIHTQEYNSWLNHPAIGNIISLIDRGTEPLLWSRIPHPLLIEQDVQVEDYYTSTVIPIANLIIKSIYQDTSINQQGTTLFSKEKAEATLKSHKIGCLLNDQGTCSRFMAAIGFKVYRIDSVKQTTPLVEQLDDLLSVQNCTTIIYSELKKITFNTIILDSSCPHSEHESLIHAATEHIFYIERNPSEDFSWFNLLSTNPTPLFTTIWNDAQVRCYYISRADLSK